MVIFDIDGVLSEASEREKVLEKVKNSSEINWKEFFSDCEFDLPIRAGMIIAKSIINYLPQQDILFLTARSEIVRNKTMKWLSEHLGVSEDKIDLTMRPENNIDEDVLFKEEVGREIGFKNIDFVIEDKEKIVDMWRSHGVICYQSKGD